METICGKEIIGFGNNPWPVKDSGCCCDKCNSEFVIPARIEMLASGGELTMDDKEKLVKQAIYHFSYGISHDIFSEPVTTYAKLAVEALEQQISKKPNDKFNVPYDILACGICPSCGLGVNSDMKFCSECGQAIDWR